MKFDDMVVLWEEVVAYKQSIAVDNAVEDAFFLLSSCMGTNIWQRAGGAPIYFVVQSSCAIRIHALREPISHHLSTKRKPSISCV